MNIKALHAFCLVMSHGSLTAASNDLNLSQPAVSRLISGLEGALRLTLFHRDKRALRPTPEARQFYREAARILHGVELLPELAREIRDGERVRLRIVSMSRVAISLVVPAVKRFGEQRPNVAITLEMHHRRDFERWLAGWQFDLGIGPLPVDTTSLTAERICTMPALAVVARDHELAKERSVTAARLAEELLIALTPDTLLQNQIDAIFAHAGVTPRQGYRTSTAQVACAMAGLGLGYTITDPFQLASVKDDVVGIPIHPIFSLDFGLLWPKDKDRSTLADDFREVVLKEVDRFRQLQESQEKLRSFD